MVTYKYQYKERQKPETIFVTPATAEHAEQIQVLAGAAYGVDPKVAEDWFSADQYRSRIEHFPEGQLVALERASGRVVGLTSSMRFHFKPEYPLLEDWERTTDYG